jgi:hypothetical protein
LQEGRWQFAVIAEKSQFNLGQGHDDLWWHGWMNDYMFLVDIKHFAIQYLELHFTKIVE